MISLQNLIWFMSFLGKLSVSFYFLLLNNLSLSLNSINSSEMGVL